MTTPDAASDDQIDDQNDDISVLEYYITYTMCLNLQSIGGVAWWHMGVH